MFISSYHLLHGVVLVNLGLENMKIFKNGSKMSPCGYMYDRMYTLFIIVVIIIVITTFAMMHDGDSPFV